VIDYALSQAGAEELERARLGLLAEVADRSTVLQLDAIGVADGWRCLDVGAGGGSVTRLLAERVGDAGSVLSVDLDTRLLESLAGDRIEVRRHDLLADPLPEAEFDLVHARNLLMHLPGRFEALRRLLAAVRPRGWLAVCEPDFNVVTISPPDQAWRRAWTAFCDAAVASGWDPGYGARLLGDLEALDVVEIHAETLVRSWPGGSAGSRLFAATLERLTERALAVGVSIDDLSAAQGLLRDPHVTFHAPKITTAWGRRPGDTMTRAGAGKQT
jgi:trans-aconitate methyltransferase